MENKIRDIALAEAGEQKILWAWSNMPILQMICKRFEKEKPFEGLRVSISVHLEAKTACLCRVLSAGGAEVFLSGSNPLSTQDSIAAALAKGGLHVFATHGCTPEEYNGYIDDILGGKPDIIVDDGGDLVGRILDRYPEVAANLIGGCEETTTGILRLKKWDRAGDLPFPMMAVNDADCKHLFDNRYGTGQSAFTAINATTNLIVAGKNVVVAGYGWCGKGVAMRAKGLGAKVIVTEVNPVRALEANMDGFSVMPMAEAARLGDVFVTVTGDCNVITKEHFLSMKNGVLLANAGHFDVEISVKQLEEIALEKKEMRPNIVGYKMPNGNWVYLLAEGRLVNIAAGDGHPVEIMDLSFAMQALGCEYLAKHRGELENHLLRIPEEIDQKVAAYKLETLGISIDSLTEEQKAYIGQ